MSGWGFNAGSIDAARGYGVLYLTPRGSMVMVRFSDGQLGEWAAVTTET